MTLKTFTPLFVISFSLGFVSQMLYSYYFRKKTPLPPKHIHEVIMFSPDRLTGIKKSKHSKTIVTENMSKLLSYLGSTKHTLDICMYVFTNLDLYYIIMKLHHKGVKVRIIIDADMLFATGSHVRRVEKMGIPVRWMKSTNLMHHKFCILDASTSDVAANPLLIMGSMNWTLQAFNGNWEDVTVTTQKQLVAQYHAEFEKLWVLFHPIV